jgi:hypothetical protein
MLVGSRVSRREVLQFSGVCVIQAAAASYVRDANGADDKATHCFLGESGWAFLIGMLLTEIPDDHKAKIAAIRSDTSYRRALKYKSTDHFKETYGERLIDYFLQQDEMRFFGSKIENTNDWPDDAQERHQIYFGMYRRLLERGKLGRIARVVVRTQDRSTTGRDQLFHEFLQTKLGIAEIHRERIKTEDLTQLVGFLTGLMRDEGELGGAKTKLARSTYLRKSLKVPEIDEAYLGEHTKYNVRNLII